MVADYRRMVWQNRANRIAEAIRVIAMGACVPGVIVGLARPSPLAAFGLIALGFLIVACLWVEHYTKQYRRLY